MRRAPKNVGNFCRIHLDTILAILTIPPDPTLGGDGASTVQGPFVKDWSHAKLVCFRCWNDLPGAAGLFVPFGLLSQWLLWSRTISSAVTALDGVSRRSWLSTAWRADLSTSRPNESAWWDISHAAGQSLRSRCAAPGTGGTSPYTPVDPNNNPTYAPNGGTNSAPPFNPTPGSTGGVPNPNDDDGTFNRQPGAQKPTITPTSGARTSDDLSSPFGEENSSRRQRNFADSQVVDADSPFETPVVQTSNTGGSDVQFANQQSEATPVSNKKYANGSRFEWVQGMVDYDDPSNTWVIIYNDNPKPSDLYGGVLTLADDPSLSRLQSGSMVRIYGSLDPIERDSRGKPLYQVTRIGSPAAAAQ